MTNWYINKEMIIKSNPNKNQILDNFDNSKIFQTYIEAIRFLSLLLEKK